MSSRSSSSSSSSMASSSHCPQQAVKRSSPGVCDVVPNNNNKKMDVYVEFNRALLEFIKDLSQSHPNVDFFRKYYTLVNLMSTMNPMTIQPLYDRNIKPYQQYILARDGTFFLNKDYTAEVTEVGESMDIVSVLKTLWIGMSATDKDMVWRHLEVLVVLNQIITDNNNNVKR